MADLTSWFPSNVKPVRNGNYEVRGGGINLMRTWRGYWCVLDTNDPSFFQDVEWRGLSRPFGVLGKEADHG